IELLPLQLPLLNAEHHFYYFGDIDHEGIHIWHLLNERTAKLFQSPVYPAIPFYTACLDRSYAYGKETHRKDREALDAFLTHFMQQDQQRILAALSDGGYYPQEI